MIESYSTIPSNNNTSLLGSPFHAIITNARASPPILSALLCHTREAAVDIPEVHVERNLRGPRTLEPAKLFPAKKGRPIVGLKGVEGSGVQQDNAHTLWPWLMADGSWLMLAAPIRATTVR
jgi:hypothetical protein